MTSEVMITEEPDPEIRFLWADLVQTHPDGSIYQTPEMFDVYRASKGFRPVLATARRGEELLGIALGVVQSELSAWYGFLAARLLVRGGPVSRECGVEAALVTRLEGWARRRAFMTIVSRQHHIENLQGHASEPHLNFLIDLSRGREAIWNGLRANARKQIRRGVRRGLKVSQDTSPEILSHYEILADTYHRAGLPLFDVSHFDAAWRMLGPSGRMRVFGAYVGGELVGTRLVLAHGRTVHDWFAGSRPEFNDRYVNDALVWAVLEWGIESGYGVFDFGGAGHPDRPYGVRDFKRKFGGELVTGVVYRRSLWLGARAAVRLGRSVYGTWHQHLKHLRRDRRNVH